MRHNGVYQDGGLLVHLPALNRRPAVFLAFQSQPWHTDDRTGHTLPAHAPVPRPSRHHRSADHRP
ncbi:DUF2278 family protein [Kitasatospora sp. NPDC059577]|uniref:DUF2278 family protein n=1 Tax=unclassified Kitasatospora TaxID=2633591 RepID=UPI003692A225